MQDDSLPAAELQKQIFKIMFAFLQVPVIVLVEKKMVKCLGGKGCKIKKGTENAKAKSFTNLGAHRDSAYLWFL